MSAHPPPPPETPIRDAATVILIRRDLAGGPHVLMGMRGKAAAFMPEKVVFPGGAVDPGDGAVPLAAAPSPDDMRRLSVAAAQGIAPALATAAVRELWEETGLILGRKGAWPGTVPADWAGFAATGHLPDAGAMRFVFRAITPPGRTRRFDARFFLAEAAALASDPDDFSRAQDELSHLQWVALNAVRRLDLPFITEVVLAEIRAQVGAGADAEAGHGTPVPFFDNSGPRPEFRRID